jgi:hypothetical protein
MENAWINTIESMRYNINEKQKMIERLVGEQGDLVDVLDTILHEWDDYRRITPVVYRDARAVLAKKERGIAK